MSRKSSPSKHIHSDFEQKEYAFYENVQKEMQAPTNLRLFMSNKKSKMRTSVGDLL